MLAGCILLSLGTLLFCRAYSRHLSFGALLSDGFLEYLTTLKEAVSNYSVTPEKARENFKNSALEKSAFLELLDAGKSHAEAFEEVKSRTSIPREVSDTLSEYFKGLGRRFRESELASLERAIGTLERAIPCLKEKAAKDSKSAYAVAFAICLGFIILVI